MCLLHTAGTQATLLLPAGTLLLSLDSSTPELPLPCRLQRIEVLVPQEHTGNSTARVSSGVAVIHWEHLGAAGMRAGTGDLPSLP